MENIKNIKLEYGIFDWDDNILHMPTLIRAYDSNLNIIWLTTEAFAKHKHDNIYTFDENSFYYFYDYDPNAFYQDILRALKLNTFGPSLKKLLQMIKNANIISIVTARGHSSNTLKEGTKLLVDNLFNQNDVEIFKNNLKIFANIFKIKYQNIDELINIYWNTCIFKGVGSTDNEIQDAIRNVNELKSNETFNIIKKIEKWSLKLTDIEIDHNVSIGFSDDDSSNVSKINHLFEKLNNIYPKFNFRVYDTSNREIKKIII